MSARMTMFGSLLISAALWACNDHFDPVDRNVDGIGRVARRQQLSAIPRAYELQEVGAEINPTPDQIGGKDNYSKLIDALSDASPCTVDTEAELSAALSGSCTRIYVPNSVTLTVTGGPYTVHSGDTLYSRRGAGGSDGALIVADDSLFLMMANSRITGLRIKGPNETTSGDGNRTGIKVEGQTGIEIDNNELSGWGAHAVAVRNGGRAHVHHNSFHHNQGGNTGYGVLVHGGKALIEANLFDYYRHAISGSGLAGEAYEARYNIILTNHPAAGAYPFDMHDSLSQECKCAGQAGRGGDWIKIHHNSFYGLGNERGDAIRIEGTPKYGGFVFRNWCRASSASLCVTFDNTDSVRVFGNVYGDANWGVDAPLDEGWKTGYFNTDSLVDLIEFRQDTAFYVRIASDTGYGAFGPPQRWGGSSSSIPLNRYRIGDVNGDNRDDLIAFDAGGSIYVWVAGSSSFSARATWGSHGVSSSADVRRFRVADVSGDGATDILIFAPATSAPYSFTVCTSSGTAFNSCVPWGSNGADLDTWRYKVADFTNDGKADVVSFETGGPGQRIYVWASTGSGFPSIPSQWATNGADLAKRYRPGWWQGKQSGDLVDLFSFETNGNLYRWANSGSSFSVGLWREIGNNP